MSSKQEPAQAPATVSPGDSGGARPAAASAASSQPAQQPVSHYQGQVIYQQQPFGTVHYQQPGQQWNQQPPQGTVHYVQYAPHQEYSEKVQSYNHFGTVHYAQPMDGEMLMRPPQYVQQQYVTSPQWYQPNQPPPQGQYIPAYAANFSVANDPAYNTSMHRGAHRRNDDFQGGPEPSYAFMQFVPFVAPIGVMESQAHASASYTANWVSSTSSIPPELRDEPESDNISQYDGQRPSSPQLNGDNWTERDEHFSPSTAHHHSQPLSSSSMRHQYNEKTERNGGAGSSTETKKTSEKRAPKKEKFDKNEEKRELTFDERLEKARQQKDRVENKRDAQELSPNPGAAQSSASQPITPRSNGQKVKNEVSNNNQNQNAHTTANNSSFNARRYTNHHQSQPVQQQQQQPPQPQQSQNNGNNSGNVFPVGGSGNGGAENNFHTPRYTGGERVPKRDNNYANRYEIASTNQPMPIAPVPPPQQRLHQHPQMHHHHTVQHHAPPNHHLPPSSSNNMGPPHHYHSNNQNPSYHQVRESGEHYRSSNYRGRGGRGGNGSFRGHHGSHQNYNQPTYMMPHQIMDPNIIATLNAFQNLNFPPGVSRLPLLPGPFGMPRQPPPPPPPQMQQDIKFQNTWLDARFSLPMPPLNMDQNRYPRGGGNISFRGRGRGGYTGGYRGGYRGQGNNYYNANANVGNGYGASTSTAAPVVYQRDVKVEEKTEVKVEEEKDKSSAEQIEPPVVEVAVKETLDLNVEKENKEQKSESQIEKRSPTPSKEEEELVADRDNERFDTPESVSSLVEAVP